jgi:hypothetical protein
MAELLVTCLSFRFLSALKSDHVKSRAKKPGRMRDEKTPALFRTSNSVLAFHGRSMPLRDGSTACQG